METVFCKYDTHGKCMPACVPESCVFQAVSFPVKLHPQKVLAAHGHALRDVQTQLQSTVGLLFTPCSEPSLWEVQHLQLSATSPLTCFRTRLYVAGYSSL